MSKNKKHFSIKTVMTIGACLIDLLQKFHEEGYVHCDIKPDNIMIGDFKNEFSEMNQLYLIDFGIASRYLDERGNHVELRDNEAFRGNVVFSSKNAFDRLTLSRRDDVISMIYVLNYLIDTRMAWVKFDKPLPQ